MTRLLVGSDKHSGCPIVSSWSADVSTTPRRSLKMHKELGKIIRKREKIESCVSYL